MKPAIAEALETIPGLAALEPRDADQIFGRAVIARLEPAAAVFHAGAECRQFLILAEGSVRVTLNAVSGRSVTLYRLEPGDTCVLTTSCLLSRRHYPAEARAETRVRAVSLESHDFERGLEISTPFRRFVLDSFSRRLASVIERMESVALTPVEVKLAALLACRDRGDGSVATTHRELADELGTAREVVSRHLKRFETKGIISLARGRISISDPAGLRAVADMQVM